MTFNRRACSRLSFALVVALAMASGLAIPAVAHAARPHIDRVVVSRDEQDRLEFRIFFASPVIVAPDDQIQVAIDADRDLGTGIDGLDSSLDLSGSDVLDERAALLTVDGEPVISHPRSLRFSSEAAGFALSWSSVTLSVPAPVIGDPGRFDFYVFIRIDGKLDEAPSHVLVSAGSLPWTYPKDGEPEAGDAYPVETYVDLTDTTLSDQPWVIVGVIAGVLVFGGALAVAGWGVERLRRRKRIRVYGLSRC